MHRRDTLLFSLALFGMFVYFVPVKTKMRVKKVKVKEPLSLPSQEVKTETQPALAVTERGNPLPEFVLREAMEEPDRTLVAEYGDSIRLLRDDKRFTFREIAEWLQERGIECDHNSVYREYTKRLSFQEEQEAAYRDAMDEEERR
jgi:hypothetical protein